MPTATLSDRVANKFVGHDVNLQRLQASQRLQIFKALRGLEDKLALKIMKDVDADKDTFTLARNRALLREVTSVIESAYGDIAEAHKGMLVELGQYEARAVATLMNRQIGVNLLTVGVPDSVIDAMVNDNTIFGAPLDSFWEQQSLSLRNKFATSMRAGIYAGETTGQLIQRVRGTRAANFTDGLMKTARSGAEVVVRTAAQSVLNDARMEVFKANEDVLDGVQAQVTLDDRTSDICMARSGFAWTMAGDPFPDTDTDEDFPGPPPWHPNCRSTLIPIVKSIGTILDDKKLDTTIERELEKLPEATQSSMNGQVAGDLTYEEWLTTQSKATQLDVLGPGRFELWDKGKISLRDLIDQRGNPLTLKQLRSKE